MTATKKQAEVAEVAVTIIPDDIKTVSGKIRYLNAQGKSRSEISKQLGIRYQHVRNVLIQPLKQKQ